MKLKNIGTKIIHVGVKVLMPEDTMPITELQANTPAIQVLIKHKKLELIADAKEATREEETKADEKTTEEKVEEKAAEEKAETKEVAQKETKKATKKAE